MRAWDNRKSKCRFVMKRIRVEIHSARKRADFGVGLFGREQMTNPLQEGKQVWAVVTLASAPSTVPGVDIMVSIVQAVVVAAAFCQRAFERLEPCAVKVARTVLRRRSGSNVALLSD